MPPKMLQKVLCNNILGALKRNMKRLLKKACYCIRTNNSCSTKNVKT